jgi:hypothetical protein
MSSSMIDESSDKFIQKLWMLKTFLHHPLPPSLPLPPSQCVFLIIFVVFWKEKLAPFFFLGWFYNTKKKGKFPQKNLGWFYNTKKKENFQFFFIKKILVSRWRKLAKNLK